MALRATRKQNRFYAQNCALGAWEKSDSFVIIRAAAERHGHHADAYEFIEPIKDRLFPKDFEYTHINPEDGVETTTTQVLFGDLIAAVEQTIDGEGATAAASNPLRGASFAPGTHAQRHRVRQSGSKHGGARRVFSRPLTPLVTKFRGSSSSAD